MSVTTTKLQQPAHHRGWGLAIDNMASPAEVVVIHRSVGIARLPYAAEATALIAWLVQVGVPEGTARALAVQLARVLPKHRASASSLARTRASGARTAPLPYSAYADLLDEFDANFKDITR